ncbi:MAG: hypothetical protein K2X35_12040 [Bryobacteraceae bacterium]|nr:hypothetical protein [Bryobacteraceae bacterium]
MSRSAEYESVVEFESARYPGVYLRVARMSVNRRLDLMKRVREIGRRLEFVEAGEQDRAEQAVIEQEIRRCYLEWGLLEVRGLRIDGEEASPQRLIAGGPEDLCGEALERIRMECGLSEEERKN